MYGQENKMYFATLNFNVQNKIKQKAKLTINLEMELTKKTSIIKNLNAINA